MRFETLEARRVLAAVSVGNTLDIVNGDTSSIAALIGDDGGDGISLREAIQAANQTPGTDDVTFAAALSGASIVLDGTEIEITEAVNIDASSMAQAVTLDANEASRVFNITSATGDFFLSNLTLTGGRTTGTNSNILDNTHSGGAVRSFTSGNLTIASSTIIGNATAGQHARGGGVFSAGPLSLIDSTVTGNRTGGKFAPGGGLFVDNGSNILISSSSIIGNVTIGEVSSGGGIATIGGGTLTIEDSTISVNMTTGVGAVGGGIAGSDVVINRSSVTDNGTLRDGASGGGIHASNLTLLQSTVSGNSTHGIFAFGGGILVGIDVSITLSTISGNSTNAPYADGGGLAIKANSSVFSNVTITQSTITDNHADGLTARGGGIWNDNDSIEITGSIFSGNTASGDPDIRAGEGALVANYSLIGTGITPDAGTSANNIFADDPELEPLHNNGGPTRTHAPLDGSPVVNAGDPAIAAVSGEFDQRGFGFTRVFGGRIDIGAYESQVATSADFDSDGDIDGADFLAWQRGFGRTNALLADGDGDNDADVDGNDLNIWQANFGATAPPLSAPVSAPLNAPVAAVVQSQSVEEQVAPVSSEPNPIEVAIAYETIEDSSQSEGESIDNPVIEEPSTPASEGSNGSSGQSTPSTTSQESAEEVSSKSDDDGANDDDSAAIDAALDEIFA